MGYIMKRVLSFLFFLNVLQADQAGAMQVYFKAGVSAETTKGKKACCGWDLNSVVFKKEVKICKMIRYSYKKNGVRRTAKGLFKFGKLWRKKKKLKRQGNPKGFVWDAMFTDMALKDPKTAGLIREFAQIANVLDLEMVSLMQRLSNHGHCHAVLSNMGQGLLDTQVKLLQAQQSKNPVAYNYILTFLQDHEHKIIASEANGWMHKPNMPIYQAWLLKNKKRGQITIFIDDKLENVLAAVKYGFDVAIHYKKGMRPADLEKILSKTLMIA